MTSAQVFSAEIYEIFKNTLVVASESLRNGFAEQMLTLQLSKIPPEQFWKKKCLPLIVKKMMRWEQGWQ